MGNMYGQETNFYQPATLRHLLLLPYLVFIIPIIILHYP
jgi:hypothetical protein